MTHAYSLRSNTNTNLKGRRQSTYETDEDQGEGTSKGGNEALTDGPEGDGGEPGTIDHPRPTTPETPRAVVVAHNSPPPGHHSHSRNSIPRATTRYQIRGPGGQGRPETQEEIQAARARVEATRAAEAVRIRREQIERAYKEEENALRARILALRRECEIRVERARRKWARARAVERGEVLVVVEESEGGLGGRGGGGNRGLNLGGSGSGEVAVAVADLEGAEDVDNVDADGDEMAVDKNYAPMETSLTANNDDDRQWPSSSRSAALAPAPSLSRSENNLNHFQPPQPLRRTQQQHLHLHLSVSLLSQRQRQEQQQQQQQQEEDHAHEKGPGTSTSASTSASASTGGSVRRRPPVGLPSPSRSGQQGQGRKSPYGRPHRGPGPQPQPLRRQPAQLMATAIPTPTPSSHGSQHTYGTAVVDPDGRTDGDNDSEMDG